MKLGHLLLTTAAMGIAASAGAAPLDYWVTSSLHNVFKDTPPPICGQAGIRLVAARNQTECSQIVLVPSREIKGVHVEFEPLVARDGRAMAPGGFSYSFIEYHKVEHNSTKTPPEQLLRLAPDDFPDAFLEERTLDISPGRNWPVMLSFAAPKSAEPGVYAGRLWLVGADARVPVEVSLEVASVTLPDDTRLSVTQWFDGGAVARHTKAELYSDGYWDALKDLGRTMHAHHQNIAWAGKGLIKSFKEPDGKITFDYSLLDKWVETFDSVGVNRLIEIDHIAGRPKGVWEENFALYPWKALDRASNKEIEISLEEWAPALQKHLEEKGWLERTAIHIADEPIEPNYQSWIDISKRFHAAAPKIKRMDAILTAKVLNDIEIAVPLLDHYDYFTKEMREFAGRDGNQLWFYTAWVPQEKYLNRLMDYPAAKTRLLHWVNYRYEITGYLHWALFQWHVPFLTFAPGDNWIVWQGSKGPRSSIRYEAMRSGIEDYELMAMLEDATARVARKLGANTNPKARTLEVCSLALRSATDYDTSPARLEAAREQLLRELASIEQTPLLLVTTDPAEGSKTDRITVTGVAEKGSSLSINATPVPIDAAGRFTFVTDQKRVTVAASRGAASKTVVRLFR